MNRPSRQRRRPPLGHRIAVPPNGSSEATGDAKVEAESLTALKEFQLTGHAVEPEHLDQVFASAKVRARARIRGKQRGR